MFCILCLIFVIFHNFIVVITEIINIFSKFFYSEIQEELHTKFQMFGFPA